MADQNSKTGFQLFLSSQYFNNKELNAEITLELSFLKKTLKHSVLPNNLLQPRILLEKVGDFNPHFSYSEKMNA
jgi:hypothetical protein